MNASVAAVIESPPTPASPALAAVASEFVEFQIDPAHYRHWKLDVAGATATLTLMVDEDGGIRPGYKLKLNSYDLGVDIELADALERVRFEHPTVRVVVITSGRERIFCSGANIYMLGTSSHAWKVNFCKFTNETRNGMEHSSTHSGIKFVAAVNGACAGGGYELALACDEILLVDDRSSAVSLPEVPLLGVLPGTGGLTRLIDKRHVRRDLADVFCTTQEGQRAERAKAWRLIDHFAKPAVFSDLVNARVTELAATSSRPADASGVKLDKIECVRSASGLSYPHLDVAIDQAARIATLTLCAPFNSVTDDVKTIEAAGAAWEPLAIARELNDAILQLRTNYLDVGTWVFKTKGERAHLIDMDQVLTSSDFWLVRETSNLWDRVLSRLDVSSRSLIALIESNSCFVGTYFELALAADRSYMLLSDEEASQPSIRLTEANRSSYRVVNGLTRLETRFHGDDASLETALATIGRELGSQQALELGLVTFTPDDIDWEEEIRLMLEERASLSPDALTGMEASLRFAGPETLETRVFGRLSAWQNWVFIRPNATGDDGALKIFGSGKRPRFDWRRV
jgi:benzoyl-CoA-dihydrodiol lyase